MTSALEQLVAFATQPNPAFVCRSARRSERGTRTFVAKVCHDLNKAPSSRDLALLRSLLGPNAPAFEGVYAVHDGFVLYQDLLSEAAGVEALPIAEWDQASHDMREWLAGLEEDNDPDHIRTGVAFATAPQSGNYFVVPVEGSSAGLIFYVNHDGWYEAPFADDFAEFVTRVTTEPRACYAQNWDVMLDTATARRQSSGFRRAIGSASRRGEAEPSAAADRGRHNAFAR